MIRIIWHPHGDITLCNRGWPQFQKLPDAPGLYRIVLKDGRFYIGEAGSLKRRLYEYRRPTSGVEQEHRVYSAIIEAGGGTLDIFTDASLSSKSARTQLERAEIKAALQAGLRLINNDGQAEAGKLRARIKFLETELAAARAKLADIEK